MHKSKVTYCDALRYVQEKHRQTRPNQFFIEQLEKYEENILSQIV